MAPLRSLDRVLTVPLADVREGLEAAFKTGLPEVDPGECSGLPPVELQEVWGAGVTYIRSREARMDEALAKDVYSRIYEADRPELFLKRPAGGWSATEAGSACVRIRRGRCRSLSSQCSPMRRPKSSATRAATT